ncbi:MAG: hypothetical protein AB7F96_05555 [Beijerinckiaceae bacterium]
MPKISLPEMTLGVLALWGGGALVLLLAFVFALDTIFDLFKWFFGGGKV